MKAAVWQKCEQRTAARRLWRRWACCCSQRSPSAAFCAAPLCWRSAERSRGCSKRVQAASLCCSAGASGSVTLHEFPVGIDWCPVLSTPSANCGLLVPGGSLTRNLSIREGNISNYISLIFSMISEDNMRINLFSLNNIQQEFW